MPPRAKASAKASAKRSTRASKAAEKQTDVEAPVVEDPKLEDPKLEDPKLEDPKSEEPNMDDLIDDVVGDAIGVADADIAVDAAVGDAAADAVAVNEQKQEAEPVEPAEPAPPPKKRPGRPKKRVVAEAIKISGVVDTPDDPEDKVEMVYQNPTLFKSIFALLKAYAAKELMMHFKEHTIDIAAHDHLDSTSMLATIDCSKLVHYYCGEETKVFIKRTEIETILHNLRKVHKRLTFILKTNYTSHIVIQTENSEMDNRNVYEVELCQINEKINDMFYTEDDYPLNFTLPAKHFKEEINSISQLSARFSIEKNYGEPLSFSFENHKTKTIMNSPYLNAKKIKLNSTVADDDIFAVSIKIDYIKPFANTKLGDDVELFVACDKKIMFKTQLDGEVCTVRVYTDIIKINPDDL